VITTIGIGNNGTASSTSNVTVGSTIAGTTTIQNAATINLNAPTVASNASSLTLFATPTTVAEFAAATSLTLGGSTGSNTINVGNGNVASGTGAVNIATNASGTGKTSATIGSTFGASSVVVQGGTGNITLNPSGASNSGVVIKPTSSNSTAAFLIQNTSGYSSLSFDTTNSTLKVWDSAVSPTNYAYISYSSNTATFSASSGVTQLGATSGNVSIPLTGSTDHFTFTHTNTPITNYSTNDYTIQRILTGGSNILSGNVLTVENRTTGTSDASTVLYINQNNASANGGYLIQAQTSGSTNALTLDNVGNLNVLTDYRLNGTSGVSITCSSGQSLVASAISGGIVTGGSCSGSTGTLQNAYDNSSSPATITTSASLKGVLFKAGASNDSTALFQVQNSSSVNLLTADSTNGLIQIGTTTGSNEFVLGLDNFSTFTDTGTCGSAGDPNGALYFNTASNAVRGCVSGGWEDLPSTADLGILLFGVVPDSATSNVGDLPALTANSPCKVAYNTVTSITIQPCTAYSGGRKVVVPSTNITLTTMTITNIWQHVCLSGTNNQPALTTASFSETANMPTFSAGNPVLCLADIKGSASTANNIAQLYDTRTFTNTQKDFVALSTAAGLGWVVSASGSASVPATTAGAVTTEGVVVATNGLTSSTTPNAIISVGGPTYAKAISGNAGNIAISSTTAGYATAGASTGAFGDMGISKTSWTATCNSSTTCLGSLYFNEALSY
jgi:hypothetical protein